MKTLILINKDRLANKNKSILLVLISVAKKTVKIAKLELNLLAFWMSYRIKVGKEYAKNQE
ncbi:hypothetical protein Y011_04875 [Vibrio parahaemolyticus VP49]|nr:hypothetical protein Y011_04875 [Vibrio parahaemolyticus VP49]